MKILSIGLMGTLDLLYLVFCFIVPVIYLSMIRVGHKTASVPVSGPVSVNQVMVVSLVSLSQCEAGLEDIISNIKFVKETFHEKKNEW